MIEKRIYLSKLDHRLYQAVKVGKENLLTMNSPVVADMVCVDSVQDTRIRKKIDVSKYKLENGIFVTTKTDQHSQYWDKWYPIIHVPMYNVSKDSDIMVGKKKIKIEDILPSYEMVTYSILNKKFREPLSKIHRFFYTGHWRFNNK